MSASNIRSLIRAVLLVVTAFGLSLSAEQVGALMLLAEAALRVAIRNPQYADLGAESEEGDY